MDLFSPELSKCEASISVITNILAKENPSKFEEISNEFQLLGFNKVMDLANSTLAEVSVINCLGSDPLAELYKATEIYSLHCANQLKSADSEFKQKNFVKTQEICKEMLLHNPSDLKCLMLLSASHFECEEYDTSMTYLQEVLDKYPDCAEILNGLGVCCFSKSEYTEALKYFSDTLFRDIAYDDAWINCAGLLTLADKKKEAETAYKMVLSFKPDLYVVRNNYAKLLLSLNRTQEAENQYKAATKIAPKDVNTWNNLGNLYYNTDKINQAIVCYKIALDSERTIPITWDFLGVAYLKSKKYQDAIDSFKQALVLCPQDIHALKNLAVAYCNLRNWPLVIDTYKKVLKFHSDDKESILQLGLAYNSLKNYQEAEKYFKDVLDLNPQEEEFHKYLIGVYQKQGKHELVCEAAISLGDLYYDQNKYVNAQDAYVCALSSDPKNVIGHWKLGNAMVNLDDLDSALKRYKYCIELKPNFANAYSECGLVLEKMDLREKALSYYEVGHALDPNNLVILQNLTYLNEKLCNFDEVIKLNNKILKHEDCDEYEVHFDLALIYHKEFGKFHDALHHYIIALQIAMTDSEIHQVNLRTGCLLVDMEYKEDALTFFKKAIEIDPECFLSHTNIGSIHKDCEKFTEAIHSYNTALKIKPDFPDAYCNLVQCLQHICDWSNYNSRITKLKKIVAKQLENDQVPSILPHHSLLYNFSPLLLRQISTNYAKLYIDKANMYRKVPQDYEHQTFLSNGRMRIGYVSSNFGDHPIAQLMQLIPNFHDRNKIEVFCYSLSPTDGSLSWSKISAESDHFKDISGLGVVDAANLIHSDGIHILVNMNGYTKGARNEIFALRPAPIQVLWLGYPHTSGATFIDYLITDQVCSPPQFQNFYTEKLAYMNQSVFIGVHKQMYSDLICRVNGNRTINLEVNTSIHNGNIHTEGDCSNKLVSINTISSMYCVKTLPDGNLKCITRKMYNLPEDVIVFCNFSPLCKVEPSTFRMWSTILKNVPNSVLWLLRFPYSGEHNLRVFAASLDIDLARIIFSSLETNEEHMLRIQLADIFLDTPLCNGHMTCLDVLWAGTPVITLPGKTFASRVAASLLTTLGCTDTIANSRPDYVRKAIKFASDKNLLESLRSKIWSLKTESKLFDCKSYTEELESVYQDMWSNFLSEKN